MNAAVSSALMHSVWQCAAIASVLAVLLIFVRSPKFRYTLACLALGAMPLAFGITYWIELPEASANVGTRFVASWSVVPIEDVGPIHSPESAPWNLAALWMVGVALVCLYRLAGWISAQRLRRRGVCAAPLDWQARMTELSQLIGSSRAVLLLESALADVPLTIGFLRPVILVPVGLLAGLPSRQVEAILLHELAHIARYDYLVNLLQAAVEALLFYHPAAWWVSHVIRRERELCCDDIVIEATGDAATYARALGTLEEHRTQQPVLAATGGSLMQRMHRLFGQATPRGASALPVLVFLILASSAALFAFHPEPMPLPDPLPVPAPAPTPVPEPAPQAQGQPVPAAVKTMPPVTDPTPAEPVPDALDSPYKKWLNEEVVWIITNEERTAFGRLNTDDERQMFIEQFWLRRDPTPDTEANEFKEEFYRRIAWANDHFGAGIPGWKSDRGMIYVKFGAPDELEKHPAVDDAFPYEKWRYKYLDGIGGDIILEFVDSTGDGTNRLTWSPDQRNALLSVPGEGLTLYQQMYQQTNMFDRLQRYTTVRRRPTK